MARTPFDPAVVRPPCPRHPGSLIRLDGYWHCRWSPHHRRPRFRCVTEPGTRGHAFSVPVAVRQPTERHPVAGAACPACAHVYARHEGVSTGRDFVFGHAEIARLLVRVGDGMSLRSASADLREHVLRAQGATSRQANLAVDYIDAYAPAVLAALHPTTWPRIVVLDTTTLFTRVPREAPDDTGAARVGNRRAGTVMVALDGTARRPRPCLMVVAGAKDADSWRAFFGRLDEAPEVVVADLDAAIARAVRETWPNALLVPSRHHLAARIRERLVADGIPERVRLEAPVATRRALPWTGERLSTGALEGAIGEWLAPLRRRAGRWQNARRTRPRPGAHHPARPGRRPRGPLWRPRPGGVRRVRQPLARCGQRARPRDRDRRGPDPPGQLVANVPRPRRAVSAAARP